MSTVRSLAWFNITRKWTRRRVTQRPSRKVAVVAATDVNTDVSDPSNEDSTDAGFCGEPFADNGELLLSLSPLLFSMKLLGLYFHREDRHRRRIDDPEWNPATTTTRTSSNRLRVYASVILILVWLNAVRLLSAFSRHDQLGAALSTKITVLTWLGLAAILQTAFYIASHTGQLIEVLLTLSVTPDCVRNVRRVAIGLTAINWASLAVNITISVCLFFTTDGQYDFNLAPFVTYIEVPKSKIFFARFVGFLLYVQPIPCTILSQMIILVLVYIFYHQFRTLEKNFRRALGNEGQFSGDFSVFRRRHCLRRIFSTSTTTLRRSL